MFKSSQKLTAAQRARNQKDVTEYFTLVLVVSVAVGYYVTFKSYHSAVQKQEQLSKLLVNENARVASGDQGAELMAKINELHATKAVKEVKASDPLTEQLAQVEALINAKKLSASKKTEVKPVVEQAQELSSIAAYAPPVPMAPTAYKIDLEQAIPQVQQPTVYAPFVSAPYPTLISAPTPTVIAPPLVQQPTPRREDVIKMLLTELSRKD